VEVLGKRNADQAVTIKTLEVDLANVKKEYVKLQRKKNKESSVPSLSDKSRGDANNKPRPSIYQAIVSKKREIVAISRSYHNVSLMTKKNQVFSDCN
jgi:hypothetical protein